MDPNTDLRLELSKQSRESHDKYDYWLLAVAASAIALAVHDTENATLQWSQMPLGCAVILWGISFFFGCRKQIGTQLALGAHDTKLQIQSGIFPATSTDANNIRFGVQTVTTWLNENEDRLRRAKRAQFGTLIAGCICFLGWHVLTMALRSKGIPTTQP